MTLVSLLPRIFVVCGLTFVYLFGRYYFDTLQINLALIRKAENAFAHYEGRKRLLSFPLVIAIHIGKMFTIDPIGSSHEYGFDCIRGVESEDDIRLIYPIGIALALLATAVVCLKRGIGSTLMFLVFASWMATLFPICGFLTVGTFIADRLTVASSFGFCVFAGKTLTMLFCYFYKRKNNEALITVALFSFMYMSNLYGRVSNRTVEWTTNVSLLESSLVTCPRSAKSNLETSKIYSGLYPEKTDYARARLLISRAEEIDPDFCDVHWQFAQLMFRDLQTGSYFTHPDDPENLDKLEEFEDRLTSSVICRHSGKGAISLFQHYWKIMTKSSNNAQLRYQRHFKSIQEEMARQAHEEDVTVEEAREDSNDFVDEHKSVNSDEEMIKEKVPGILTEEVADAEPVAKNGVCEDPLTCGANNIDAFDVGVPQKVTGAENEKRKTNATIEKSLKYRNTIIAANPQLAAGCVNTSELCAFWASLGECKVSVLILFEIFVPLVLRWLIHLPARIFIFGQQNNPGFMSKGCKLACQLCSEGE